MNSVNGSSPVSDSVVDVYLSMLSPPPPELSGRPGLCGKRTRWMALQRPLAEIDSRASCVVLAGPLTLTLGFEVFAFMVTFLWLREIRGTDAGNWSQDGPCPPCQAAPFETRTKWAASQGPTPWRRSKACVPDRRNVCLA